MNRISDDIQHCIKYSASLNLTNRAFHVPCKVVPKKFETPLFVCCAWGCDSCCPLLTVACLLNILVFMKWQLPTLQIHLFKRASPLTRVARPHSTLVVNWTFYICHCICIYRQWKSTSTNLKHKKTPWLYIFFQLHLIF